MAGPFRLWGACMHVQLLVDGRVGGQVRREQVVCGAQGPRTQRRMKTKMKRTAGPLHAAGGAREGQAGDAWGQPGAGGVVRAEGGGGGEQGGVGEGHGEMQGEEATSAFGAERRVTGPTRAPTHEQHHRTSRHGLSPPLLQQCHEQHHDHEQHHTGLFDEG